jgi:hypothetical protein
MQFESKEPSHGTFAPLCYAFKCPVDMYPLVAADANRSTVNKTDSGTLAQNTFLMNKAKGIATSFSSSTKRLYETTFGKRWRRCLQTLSR